MVLEDGSILNGERTVPVKTHGYFGSNSITWRVGSEAILYLGGSRAVLMQLAHPLVAMGVSEHSRYMTDPYGRAIHTFMLGQMLAFGSTATAHQAARTINLLHAHVRGTLPARAGDHQGGTIYSARDPELLLWVHATLVDTILHIYPLFIGPLSHDEQEQYYQESKRMAALLGLSPKDMPPTIDDLRQYINDMVYSNRLAATPQARQLVRKVLFPPAPIALRPFLHLHLQMTAALLPPPIRAIYDLQWGPKRQSIFDLCTRSLRLILPRVPVPLRILPVTHKLMRQGETMEKPRWSQRTP